MKGMTGAGIRNSALWAAFSWKQIQVAKSPRVIPGTLLALRLLRIHFRAEPRALSLSHSWRLESCTGWAPSGRAGALRQCR